MNTATSHMNKFSAIYVFAGLIRRVSFEAVNLQEARQLTTTWGFGLEGEAHEEAGRGREKAVDPEAFDSTSARRLLGGISRTTLYRLLARKKLGRLPDTRKVLVTRISIDRYCSRGA